MTDSFTTRFHSVVWLFVALLCHYLFFRFFLLFLLCWLFSLMGSWCVVHIFRAVFLPQNQLHLPVSSTELCVHVCQPHHSSSLCVCSCPHIFRRPISQSLAMSYILLYRHRECNWFAMYHTIAIANLLQMQIIYQRNHENGDEGRACQRENGREVARVVRTTRMSLLFYYKTMETYHYHQYIEYTHRKIYCWK